MPNCHIDCYPRVLEHIINTQSPQVLCRDYKEILGTLDIISTDPGKVRFECA
uniref:Uncharacterized protein n=1 Tax=Anopheles christyi TaxID=43041 RepID=A0A182KJ66_9DIPT